METYDFAVLFHEPFGFVTLKVFSDIVADEVADVLDSAFGGPADGIKIRIEHISAHHSELSDGISVKYVAIFRLFGADGSPAGSGSAELKLLCRGKGSEPGEFLRCESGRLDGRVSLGGHAVRQVSPQDL